MIVNFVVHDADGVILRTGSCVDTDMPLQAQTGETVIEGEANDELQKVVNGAVVDKTAIPYLQDKASITADGIDASTLSGLPDGTLASCQGQEVTSTLGEVTFAVDLAGSYEIELTNPLYLPTTVTVTAV